MSKRTMGYAWSLVALLAVAPCVSAQTDNIVDLTGKTAFTSDDQNRLDQAVAALLDTLVAGTDSRLVDAARKQLVALAQSANGTAEFRQLAAKTIVKQAGVKMSNPILVYKNRLALTIVLAQIQEADAVPLLLKLMVGEGADGERYAGVRYWAAKGLAGKAVSEAIVQGRAPESIRRVLADLEKALIREKDGICLGAMIEAVAALGTDAASDLLIRVSSEKAKTLNLADHDIAEAMRVAVTMLDLAYKNDIRPIPDAKQPIVAAMAQILARTPPHSDGLLLISAIDETLARLTGETTGLSQAVTDVRGRPGRPDARAIDGVWLEQLNWIEILLRLDKPGKKELRIKQRPVLLDWSPAKSAEVASSGGTR